MAGTALAPGLDSDLASGLASGDWLRYCILASGVRDIGRLYSGKNLFFQPGLDSPETVLNAVQNNGYEAVERLSLSTAYIAKKRYPDKLSQLFISSAADLEI